MKRIALLDRNGNCLTVAPWDGASAWDPVAAGQCASTQDVTAEPQIGPGWTFAAGAWSAPTNPSRPDPNGFVVAVAADAALATPTRLAAVNAEGSLVAATAADNTALIAAVWQLMIATYAISTADQAAVHAHAVAFGIPGI